MTARTRLQQVTGNTLFRNTSWQLVAEGSQLLIQSLAFVMISRVLGPEGVGAFAGAMALVFLMVPFAAWGSGHILIMHVARKPSSFPAYWGNALLIVLASGGVLTLLSVAIAGWFVPSLPLRLVLTLAVAEFFFGKLSDMSAQVFRAFERMSGAAQQLLVEGLFRLIATAIFIAVAISPTPEGWAIWYLGATILESLIGVARVWRVFGRPRPEPALIWRNLGQGGLFSVNQASASIYNNIDKTMLARLAPLEATGIYATAYRIIDMAFIPVKSLVFATYPRFFKAGAKGIDGSLAFAWRLLPFSIGAGLAITLGLYLVAPLMPYVFGPEYQAAVGAIRWLALIPLFRSLHNIAANTLTGAGRQGVRSIVQIGVAMLNVALNLWLIPRYSWQGAAYASLISDGALALVLWPLVWLVRGRAGTAMPSPGGPSGEGMGQLGAPASGEPALAHEAMLSRPPAVSIIINNYNYGAFLKEAIDSALRQTYEHVEVIVVDDGSTDDSRAIIAGYGDRVAAVLQPNAGQSAAFNAGLARSSGDIVIFLDADDILLPHICAQVAHVFATKPSTAKVQYRLEVVDALGASLGLVKPPGHVPMRSGDLRQQVLRCFDDISWQSTSGNAFAGPVLRQIFPVPENAYTHIGADYYVVNLAALFGPVESLDQIGGYYRIHGSNNHNLSHMSLDRARDIIRWIGKTHEYIQQYAERLGLDPHEAADLSGVRFLAYRVASLKLDPLRHPIEDDRLLALCWRAAIASCRRSDLSVPMRLIFVLWFAAMLLAPRRLALWLAEKHFYPETRWQFNWLLSVLGHRL